MDEPADWSGELQNGRETWGLTSKHSMCCAVSECQMASHDS